MKIKPLALRNATRKWQDEADSLRTDEVSLTGHRGDILATTLTSTGPQSAQAPTTGPQNLVPPTISLLAGVSYTQNFDGLSNTAGSTTNSLTINGWTMTETGGGARDNEQYAVDTGASTTGDTYSYGIAAATDRALGSLRSGTLISNFGAAFTNGSGATITSLDISYIGEQWRLGSAARTDRIDFQISFDATDLVTGTWTDVNELDFTTPNTVTTGAKDGNDAANRTSLSHTLTGLNIANGATFWIRWVDSDATGADDGLAVDDFSITALDRAAGPGDARHRRRHAGRRAMAEPRPSTFTVTRSGGSTGAVGVDLDFGHRARRRRPSPMPRDFDAATLSTGTVSFADGETSETITVRVQGDNVVETDETFIVVLSSGDRRRHDHRRERASARSPMTIAVGTLSIDDVTLAEGDSGTTAFTFTVTRSGGDDGAVERGLDGQPARRRRWRRRFRRFTGHAQRHGQLRPTARPARRSPSTSAATPTFEPDETFTVTLSNAERRRLAGHRRYGTGTITNDDAAPAGTLIIDDVSLAEGDGGPTTFTFTVSRTGGSAGAVTADYVISAPGGAGNADAADFVAGAVFSGQVSFADGETDKTITIDVEGDTVFEPDEAFTVTLSNPTGGALIGDASGAGTIQNDDVAPATGSVSVSDVSVTEGDAGTSILTFTLTRTGGTGAFDVNYATSNGGLPDHASATAGSDYLAASGTVSFGVGVNTQTVQVTINGDLTPELSEEFTLTLSGATNGATIGDGTAIGLIVTDDVAPASTLIFSENFTGFTGGGFAPTPAAGQIDSDIWRVVGLSDIANPAYGFTATTGDFARGSITTNDPTTAGVYSLSSNAAMIIQATGAEMDVGGFIEARIVNTSGSTATGFDVAFDWVYRNNADRASSLTFSYSTDGTNFITVPAAAFTTPGTLVSGATFTAQNESLSLGGLSVANGDAIYFRWTHASSAGSGSRDEFGIDNVTVSTTGGATGPLVSVSDVSVNEAAGTMTFTVTRANVAAGAFTVDYATADGTALAGSDYVATSGTLTFADNQTSATVTVQITDEGIPELDETFFLNLSNPVGATVADAQAVGTIVNDDGTPIQVSVNDVSIVEGQSGTSILTFTVTRTGGTGAFDVSFATADDTATAGSDYRRDLGHAELRRPARTRRPSRSRSTAISPRSRPSASSSTCPTRPTTPSSSMARASARSSTTSRPSSTTSRARPISARCSPARASTPSTSPRPTSYTIRAIVTAVDNVGNRQGFYVTEEVTDWDGNSYTSEGIFVMTRNDAGVGNVGRRASASAISSQFSANVMEYQAFSTHAAHRAGQSDRAQRRQLGQPAADPRARRGIPNEILTVVKSGLFRFRRWRRRHVRRRRSTPSPFSRRSRACSSPSRTWWSPTASSAPRAAIPIFQAYSLDSANADQINSRGGYTIAGDPPLGPPDTPGTGDDTVNGGAVLHDGDVNPDIIEVDFTDFAIFRARRPRHERLDGRLPWRHHRHHRFRLHRPEAVRHRHRSGLVHRHHADDRRPRRSAATIPQPDRRDLQRRESRSGRWRRALHRDRQCHRQQPQFARHHLHRGDAGQ